MERPFFAHPPFIADAVKMTALDRIERYRALQNSSRADPERTTRIRIVQGMLMADIDQLLHNTLILSDSLEKRRGRVWITRILIAGGANIFLQSPKIHDFLGRNLRFDPRWIVFAGYIFSFYGIFKFERSTSGTRRVKEGLEKLHDNVRREDTLHDSDIAFLTGDAWKAVPWRDIEKS